MSATRVCNRGPVTKVCNRGGARDNTGFDPQPYVHIYIYIYIYTACVYVGIHIYICILIQGFVFAWHPMVCFRCNRSCSAFTLIQTPSTRRPKLHRLMGTAGMSLEQKRPSPSCEVQYELPELQGPSTRIRCRYPTPELGFLFLKA